MYIQFQTKLTEPMTIYDTETPIVSSTEPSISSKVKDILQPIVQVKMSDGTVLYKTGDFYQPWPVGKWLVGSSIGLGVLFLLFGILRR